MKKFLSLLVLLIFGVSVAFAQTYSPDRPGIGNGSYITPANMVGLEAGVEFSVNSGEQQSNSSQQVNIGQLLIRYGITDNLEARVNLGSYSSAEVSLIGAEVTRTGFQDISIGTKYNFLSGTGTPNVSALAEVSLPAGDDEFSSGEVVPTLGILADHAVNEDLAISSNLGYSFGVGDLEDSWLFTLTPGFSIGSNMGAYAGYAGVYYGNVNQHWAEGGLTYGLESGVQLDINLGYETEDEIFFIGVGFAQGF